MSSRTARLAEHANTVIRDDIHLDSAHGLLPSECSKCNGFLDFVRVHNSIEDKDKTILRCRECKHELNLD